MRIWKWIQPNDRVWKVVSDYEKGTIYVFDEEGRLLLKHKGLTKQVIKMIEKNFLAIVASNKKDTPPSLIDNPMYV
jgi:hypothetical protein